MHLAAGLWKNNKDMRTNKDIEIDTFSERDHISLLQLVPNYHLIFYFFSLLNLSPESNKNKILILTATPFKT